MSKVEEPVSIGADAFKAARASVADQSKDPEPPPETEPADDTPADDKPAQAPEKPADEPTEPGDDDTLLTDEDAAKLTGDAKKQFDRMNKAFTQKTQRLAAARKELEPWKPLIAAMTADPEAALVQLAKERGFTLTKAEAAKIEAAGDDIPEELRFLTPLLEARDKRMEAKIRAELAPLKEAQTQLLSESIAKETEADIATFTAKYPGWEKHEPKMIELGQKIQPVNGMSAVEYTEILYKLATADLSEAERTKKVVGKINKAVAAAEPQVSGVSGERVEHAMPPPDKRSMRDAFEAAKRGEVWAAKD